jgi:heat shock protein HslJ
MKLDKMQTFALCLLAAAACSRSGILGDPVGAPTPSELAHATYSGVMNEPVTLISGRWEGEPYVDGGASRPAVGLVEHYILLGDLNGDGLAEAVTLLWENSDGSGNRLYLAAVARNDEAITNLGTAMIGDRVQIRSGTIEDGTITLDIVRAGPEDAACCPTEKALVTWMLGEDGLSRIADQTIGTLSLADLGGHEWVLIEFPRDRPLPQNVEISLVFHDDKVSGNSGCNEYFAGVVTSSPGELEFNGMGATRMACPEPAMDLERRYLQALAGASGYRFLAGRLVLTCDTDEGPQVLVFTPKKNPAESPEETGE